MVSKTVLPKAPPTALPTPLPLLGREAACNLLIDGEVYCIDPLEEAIGVLSKRWALLVIGILGNRDGLRFNEAKRAIPGITPRALSDVLAALQDAGLVQRDVDASASPPAVSYHLTPHGESLRVALVPLLCWAAECCDFGPASPAPS